MNGRIQQNEKEKLRNNDMLEFGQVEFASEFGVYKFSSLWKEGPGREKLMHDNQKRRTEKKQIN